MKEHELKWKGLDMADRMRSDMERYTEERKQERANI